MMMVSFPVLLVLSSCALNVAAVSPTGRRSRSFHNTANGQLHCVSQDGEGPVILAIHGNPRSTDEFTELFDVLDGESWAYIAIDFFGQGHSDPGLSNYTSIQEYAEFFFAAATGAFPGRSIVPMGSYTGAAVAIEIARLHPESVSQAVLHVPFYCK